MIPKQTEERIKSEADIQEVLEDYGVVLHRRGANLLGLCPFHDDRKLGSFQVSTEKNICSCYSCGITGMNPIDTVIRLHFGNLPEKEAYKAALHYIADLRHIPIDDDYEPEQKPLPKIPKILRSKTQLILWNVDVMAKPFKQYNDLNPLLGYLRKLPLSDNDKARLEKAINNYCVGTYPQGTYAGWTIWWYIDNMGYVRSGKMMAYKPDGHRNKDVKPNFTWSHSIMQRWKVRKDGTEYENPNWKWDNHTHHVEFCFFGQHLLEFCPDAVIRLVESEKTAVICSAFNNPKDVLYMASGGLSMMSDDKLLYLLKKGRKVELLPDMDGYGKWEEKVTKSEKLKPYIKSGHLRISDIVKRLWKPEDGEKADIADIMIRIVTEPRVTLGMKVAAQLGAPEKAEVLDEFINALNLRAI